MHAPGVQAVVYSPIVSAQNISEWQAFWASQHGDYQTMDLSRDVTTTNDPAFYLPLAQASNNHANIMSSHGVGQNLADWDMASVLAQQVLAVPQTTWSHIIEFIESDKSNNNEQVHKQSLVMIPVYKPQPDSGDNRDSQSPTIAENREVVAFVIVVVDWRALVLDRPMSTTRHHDHMDLIIEQDCTNRPPNNVATAETSVVYHDILSSSLDTSTQSVRKRRRESELRWHESLLRTFDDGNENAQIMPGMCQVTILQQVFEWDEPCGNG